MRCVRVVAVVSLLVFGVGSPALAQDSEATGEDFLLAIVCGYEAGAVIGKALYEGRFTLKEALKTIGDR